MPPPKELGALLASLCLSLLFACDGVAAPGIVINELHIDEDDKTRRGEFIELYNNSGSDIDVSGWFFSSGINQAGPTPSDPAEDFVIPNPTSIPARGYLVIAQDPAEMVSLFGYAGALGPWVGKLSNRGETVTLNDSGGNVIDEVTYQLGWPWPTVGDPPSPSMELINPDLDNDLGGSWRSSGNIPASSLAPAEYILREDTQWHYRKGITFPSNDVGGDDWTKNGYDENDDGEWLISQAPFGHGDGDGPARGLRPLCTILPLRAAPCDRAGVRDRAGFVPQRNRQVCAHFPARCLLPGKRRHLHQRRPPRPIYGSRPQAARCGQIGLADTAGNGQCHGGGLAIHNKR